MLAKIRAAIDGKKMYLLMVSGIVGAIASWSNGQLGDMEAIMAIWAALGFGAAKSAIAKTA